jgi:hypothetical protein
MSNIEGMYSINFILRQSAAIPSFDILRFAFFDTGLIGTETLNKENLPKADKSTLGG